MKKTNKIIGSLLALVVLASCNLEKFPDKQLNTENAMESVSDCQAFRNGMYAGTKYAFTGGFIYCPELQTDHFHAVKNFGNFNGAFYHYSLTASEGTASSAWFGFYGYIANANFLIAGTQKLLESGTLSAADQKLVEQYYGEACYMRAHMHFLLAQYFCEDYDPETAANKLGIPYVTVYEPTGDASKYPARGTLADTFAGIDTDLKEAETYITAAGAQNSAYLTSDAVKAFRARLALTMHDYDTAFTKAKELIDGGTYPLMSSQSAYANGWINDNLTETIWQAAMTGPDDTGNATGTYFIYNTSGVAGEDNPQYVPEDWVLDLYDQANDIRYASYFSKRNLTTPVVGSLTLLVKYPGNPTLYSAVTNYVNKPKIFRISEMYLIAAEAAANSPKIGDGIASLYLNELRKKRIANWTDKNYSGVELMREIREERTRELFGEGFRLFDLKRWHLGFTRSAGQDPDLMMPGENYVSCTRPADDPNFLWPIPTAEMEANPQMEQNEAYKR